MNIVFVVIILASLYLVHYCGNCAADSWLHPAFNNFTQQVCETSATSSEVMKVELEKSVCSRGCQWSLRNGRTKSECGSYFVIEANSDHDPIASIKTKRSLRFPQDVRIECDIRVARQSLSRIVIFEIRKRLKWIYPTNDGITLPVLYENVKISLYKVDVAAVGICGSFRRENMPVTLAGSTLCQKYFEIVDTHRQLHPQQTRVNLHVRLDRLYEILVDTNISCVISARLSVSGSEYLIRRSVEIPFRKLILWNRPRGRNTEVNIVNFDNANLVTAYTVYFLSRLASLTYALNGDDCTRYIVLGKRVGDVGQRIVRFPIRARTLGIPHVITCTLAVNGQTRLGPFTSTRVISFMYYNFWTYPTNKTVTINMLPHVESHSSLLDLYVTDELRAVQWSISCTPVECNFFKVVNTVDIHTASLYLKNPITLFKNTVCTCDIEVTARLDRVMRSKRVAIIHITASKNRRDQRREFCAGSDLISTGVPVGNCSFAFDLTAPIDQIYVCTFTIDSANNNTSSFFAVQYRKPFVCEIVKRRDFRTLALNFTSGRVSLIGDGVNATVLFDMRLRLRPQPPTCPSKELNLHYTETLDNELAMGKLNCVGRRIVYTTMSKSGEFMVLRNGQIQLSRQLDYEKTKLLETKIKVTERFPYDMSVFVYIKLHVLPINEFPPIFEWKLSTARMLFSTDDAMPSNLFFASATDEDAGEDGVLKYEISRVVYSSGALSRIVSQHFDINNNTSLISYTDKIGFTRSGLFTFSIVATDKGVRHMSTKKDFLVRALKLSPKILVHFNAENLTKTDSYFENYFVDFVESIPEGQPTIVYEDFLAKGVLVLQIEVDAVVSAMDLVIRVHEGEPNSKEVGTIQTLLQLRRAIIDVMTLHFGFTLHRDEIQIGEFCSSEIVYTPLQSFLWPVSKSGIVVLECPSDVNQKIERECTSGRFGLYWKAPNRQACGTNNPSVLQNINIQNDLTESSLLWLDDIANRISQKAAVFTPTDFLSVVSRMRKFITSALSKQLKTAKDIQLQALATKKVFQVLHSLLETSRSVEDDNVVYGDSDQFVSAAGSLANLMSDDSVMLNGSLALATYQVRSNAPDAGSFDFVVRNSNASVNEVSRSSQPRDDFNLYVRVRGECLKSPSKARLVFVSKPSLFHQRNGKPVEFFDDNMQLISGVLKVYASVDKPSSCARLIDYRIRTPVSGDAHDFSCVYFDKLQGIWSTQGCTVVSIKKNTVSCACDHLTTFSVAVKHVNRHKTTAHHLLLIGCVFMIVEAVIVFSAIVILKPAWRSVLHKLTMSHCILSTIGGVLFLLELYMHQLRGRYCVTISIAIYFIFLLSAAVCDFALLYFVHRRARVTNTCAIITLVTSAVYSIIIVLVFSIILLVSEVNEPNRVILCDTAALLTTANILKRILLPVILLKLPSTTLSLTYLFSRQIKALFTDGFRYFMCLYASTADSVHIVALFALAYQDNTLVQWLFIGVIIVFGGIGSFVSICVYNEWWRRRFCDAFCSFGKKGNTDPVVATSLDNLPDSVEQMPRRTPIVSDDCTTNGIVNLPPTGPRIISRRTPVANGCTNNDKSTFDNPVCDTWDDDVYQEPIEGATTASRPITFINPSIIVHRSGSVDHSKHVEQDAYSQLDYIPVKENKPASGTVVSRIPDNHGESYTYANYFRPTTSTVRRLANDPLPATADSCVPTQAGLPPSVEETANSDPGDEYLEPTSPQDDDEYLEPTASDV